MTQSGQVGDLTGRTVVITGASSGIGRAAATALAGRGAQVVLVGRDETRLAHAADLVRAAAGGREPPAYRADFTRLADVHVLVDRLRQRYERIDVLANNAGGVLRRGRVTADGYEMIIQTNHLAGFLLSNLLREQLRNGRIINTASAAHSAGAADPDEFRAGRSRFRSAYSTSKLANLLFTAEAARRWPDILSTAFHPGFVKTRFGATLGLSPLIALAPFGKTPEQGADTLVWLASTPRQQLVNGGYYVERTAKKPAPRARDEVLAAGLWTASLAAVGLS